jgi:hypothetical protein
MQRQHEQGLKSRDQHQMPIADGRCARATTSMLRAGESGLQSQEQEKTKGGGGEPLQLAERRKRGEVRHRGCRGG